MRKQSNKRSQCVLYGGILVAMIFVAMVLCCLVLNHTNTQRVTPHTLGNASFDQDAFYQQHAIVQQCHYAHKLTDSNTSDSCRSRMIWPLQHVHVVHSFDLPAQPWLAGNRGVDLQAAHDDVLIAPADGVIAVVGKVGGKDVVTIRHGTYRSTFEPAISERQVGQIVKQGEAFAVVKGHSNHCDEHCVHWGVKRDKRQYADPTSFIKRLRITMRSIHLVA